MADIYSRTWLFQRLPPWPELGSCTARLCCLCAVTQPGSKSANHLPGDNGAVLSQNNKITLFMLCVLKLYGISDKQSSTQTATETQPNHRGATKLPQGMGTLLSKLHLLDHSWCCPQRRPPTSLMSLSSAMCSECCRRRSFLRCVLALRLAQRLQTQGRHVWEGKQGERLAQELKDIQWVCSRRWQSPSLDLAVNRGMSWCLASPWETTWGVTDQHSSKGQKSRWKCAQLPARVSSESSWYLKCKSCHSIDTISRQVTVLSYPTPLLHLMRFEKNNAFSKKLNTMIYFE